MLDATTLHFQPLVNPDGYAFTWTGHARESGAAAAATHDRLRRGILQGTSYNSNPLFPQARAPR